MFAKNKHVTHVSISESRSEFENHGFKPLKLLSCTRFNYKHIIAGYNKIVFLLYNYINIVKITATT